MIVFWFAVCAVIGYLLGSFNGAILVSRWIRKEDIRSKGSGNAGLTNFYRNYGGADTLLVLLIDVGKTVAACFIGRAIMKAYDPVWFDEGAMLCGGMTVIGHMFPLWFGFKGGKGILTCGTLAAFIDWRSRAGESSANSGVKVLVTTVPSIVPGFTRLTILPSLSSVSKS